MGTQSPTENRFPVAILNNQAVEMKLVPQMGKDALGKAGKKGHEGKIPKIGIKILEKIKHHSAAKSSHVRRFRPST